MSRAPADPCDGRCASGRAAWAGSRSGGERPLVWSAAAPAPGALGSGCAWVWPKPALGPDRGVLGRLSRRARSAWAAAQGWAAMAEVALLNRRRARTDGLGMIAAAILAERSLEAGTDAGAPRLVAVDTTTGVPPGAKRACWLVPPVVDLGDLRFRAVEVTGRSEPERWARGGRANDALPTVVMPVPTIWPGSGRAAPPSWCGRLPTTPAGLIRSVARSIGRLVPATRERPTDQPVVVSKGKRSPGVPARPIIIPLEPEAAQPARARAQRPALGAIGCSEAAIERAGHLMLPTSLPRPEGDQGSPEDGRSRPGHLCRGARATACAGRACPRPDRGSNSPSSG